MKKFLTMWQMWAAIAVILAATLVFNKNSFGSILPFALFLICPLMMLFMMGSHKNHKD